ncbi:hypothetical protein [Sulfurimonas paralvinellae]|uniref:Uncharacterized protein n=1 Tax=Sulfurimonas paralvinellae TaxID=317658 RepID=A0A7M1B5V4_9BACT|nr:hypothetical protein [Sulfurimonas paralvinellae]QOP45104.1 hypothetical protein FM071_01855 [Sulfurimonas paralvinellae]
MLKLFLNTTDKFLCNSVRSVFQKTEAQYSEKISKEKLIDELNRFKENPLECTLGMRSEFQKNVKTKIKLILGIFFVFIPLLVFGTFSYLTHIDITFAIFSTLAVALLVSSRMETIAKRYVNLRELELQH